MIENKSSKRQRTLLGNNIRAIRKAYGVRLEDVAEAINVSRSTIGAYETGEREPPKETLAALAKYYMIPVDLLLQGTLCETKVDEKKICKLITNNLIVLFPIFDSEKALDNDHFRRAIKIQKEMYKLAAEGNKTPFYNIDQCFDEYEKAEEDKTIEKTVVANYLALSFAIAMFVVPNSEIVETKPALLGKMALYDQAAETLLYESDPEMLNNLIRAAQAIKSPDYLEGVNEWIKLLKRSSEWSDLADYYIALQYLWNIVDNDFTADINRVIGLEFINAFQSIGNKYAKQLKKIINQGYL